MWIAGRPGSGKTVLLQDIARVLFDLQNATEMDTICRSFSVEDDTADGLLKQIEGVVEDAEQHRLKYLPERPASHTSMILLLEYRSQRIDILSSILETCCDVKNANIYGRVLVIVYCLLAFEELITESVWSLVCCCIRLNTVKYFAKKSKYQFIRNLELFIMKYSLCKLNTSLMPTQDSSSQ
eukprot:GILJ01014553.1.p1 GENE.GILJ01014553.1~~GILJ01014553.1.p1  ORF type:complete len:182 (+),score=6.16 GILJ01014553.1:250-795(+)